MAPADFQKVTFHEEFFGRAFAMRDGKLVTSIPWEPGQRVLAFTYFLWFIPAGRLVESRRNIKAAGLAGMNPHENARVLVMVEEDFCGWVGDEVWNDMTFFVQHGDRIEKIAIVGNPKWESRMLMFTGAGFRRAPVKYFARERLAEAEDWLL